MVIAAVKDIHIPCLARPLPDITEGHLTDASHFLKQAGRLLPAQEIEAVRFLAYQQGRGGQIGYGVFEKGRGQRRGQGTGIDPASRPFPFPKRITAQAQVVVTYAGRRQGRQNLAADGRAKAQRNGGMALLEQFPRQKEGTQSWMHQPGHRKRQAVAALEIERDDGCPTPGGEAQGRIMPVGIADAPPLLPVGNRPRRKDGHSPSILQMTQSLAQSLHIALPGLPRFKGVHFDERARQSSQGMQEAVGHDPQIGTQRRQPCQKDQTFQQAERMVGDKNQRPLSGHRRHVEADPDAQRGQGAPGKILRGFRSAQRLGEGAQGLDAQSSAQGTQYGPRQRPRNKAGRQSFRADDAGHSRRRRLRRIRGRNEGRHAVPPYKRTRCEKDSPYGPQFRISRMSSG